MLYKESAIAVVIAVMLVAASFFGGLLMVPALATHDPNAIPVASKQISQDNDQSMIVDAIDLTGKKSTSRASGTLTIEFIQDDSVLGSTTLEAAQLTEVISTVEVGLTNINVTGSFEVRVEYVGTGLITVSDIDIIEGTDVASLTDDDEPSNSEDPETKEPEQPGQQLDGIEIVRKTIAQGSEDEMVVDTVEFSAKKSTSRASGTITVAILQDDMLLESEEISTSILETSLAPLEASFDDVQVTDDFEVVFVYEGSGLITISDINVPETTEPAQNPPNNPPNNPPPSGDTVTLTVNAIDLQGNEVIGMWIEVYSGMSASGEPLFTGDTPETFELEPGEYIVAVADFGDNIFQRWSDSAHDRTREATLTTDETFTALYSTNGSLPPQDSQTPPPSTAGPGSIAIFAHRIPSPNWGPTFTSASAGMWYVLYNSTGWIVQSGLTDEDGVVIDGLNDDQTYYVYATDCDECHEAPHDVVFDHWEDNTTENPRAVTTGDSAHAYYRFDPDS